MKTLHLLNADDPGFQKELESVVMAARYAEAHGPVKYVLFTAGMTDREVLELMTPLPFPSPQLALTSYPSTVSMHLSAAEAKERKVHVIVGKPVRYEPHASTFNCGGLTIPAVFDPELGICLAKADIVTLCVASHE